MVLEELKESCPEYAWRFETTLLGAHRCWNLSVETAQPQLNTSDQNAN